MAGKISPFVQSDDGGSSDGGTSTEDTSVVSLATLGSAIQQAFTSSHIGWNGINWSLFPAIAPHPNLVPDYTITHDLDSISVFVPISAVNPPEFLTEVDQYGRPVTEDELDELGQVVLDDQGEPVQVPVFVVDEFGNPVRIVDSAADLFLAIGGTDGSDHLRNRDYSFPDGGGEQRQITGAFLGFSGDDVLYSQNLNTPILVGGSGDDSYIIENDYDPFRDADQGNIFAGQGIVTQVVEYGGDDNDSIISYSNEWVWSGDIDGQHLFLSNAEQTNVLIYWNYKVADAKVENFWFDFDQNGLNEHYSYEEFTSTLRDSNGWLGSLQPEVLGISRTTLNDLTQAITEAVTLSDQIESYRLANIDVVLPIARLYQAAFDRTPDLSGLNYWIDQWESVQLSIGQIADGFYISEEFNSTYGNLDDDSYIFQLYANVLDRTPDEVGFDYWVDRLDDGMSRPGVLASFSESLENKINTEVQLSGLAESTPGNWIL
ncbi:hypothetical protein A9Q90_03045 [Gammaproteobacteria bacterium 54_18_T64]|nr:hypothetical protein A9Q90_03045 [Gammaproteobacteria bacterium 54_18_T64]